MVLLLDRHAIIPGMTFPVFADVARPDIRPEAGRKFVLKSDYIPAGDQPLRTAAMKLRKWRSSPVLHCGPGWALNGGAGGSVCTATYPLTTNGNPTVIVLTAPKGAGLFGGWSYNCTPSDINGNPLNPSTITEGGPNYCVVTFLPVGPGLTGGPNITVGAIFN